MPSIRITAVALAATAAAGLTAAPALAAGVDHTMIPFEELGGVKVGWSPARVMAKLGKPDDTSHRNGKILGLEYFGDGIGVIFDVSSTGDPVAEINAAGKGFHTFKGIHTGMSESALKAKLKGDPRLSCTSVSCTLATADHLSTTTFVFNPRHVVDGFGIFSVGH